MRPEKINIEWTINNIPIPNTVIITEIEKKEWNDYIDKQTRSNMGGNIVIHKPNDENKSK